MRKTCGGEKWGRFSRACLECERRGGYRTPKSVFCLLWGSSRRNVERPGVQSGKEAAPNSPAPRPRSSGGGPGVESGEEQGAGPGWEVGTPRGLALTPGHSTRPHVGHNPITMRTAGHDHGYKSDITPEQHAKTRPRPGVTPTIHDTVFDLWTTQAQGRTQ